MIRMNWQLVPWSTPLQLFSPVGYISSNSRLPSASVEDPSVGQESHTTIPALPAMHLIQRFLLLLDEARELRLQAVARGKRQERRRGRGGRTRLGHLPGELPAAQTSDFL